LEVTNNGHLSLRPGMDGLRRARQLTRPRRAQALANELIRPAGKAVQEKAGPLAEKFVDVGAAPAKQLARDAVPLTEKATREARALCDALFEACISARCGLHAAACLHGEAGSWVVVPA